MSFLSQEKSALADIVRSDRPVSRSRQLRLAATLSIPSIMAQISAIIMQYIDASMVGRLGAGAAASIGLVTTSTWIFFGLCSAASAGFSVQVAHRLGAGDSGGARSVFRQSLLATLIYSVLLAAIGLAISRPLPAWLGGEEAIRPAATAYFAIFMAAIPMIQYSFLTSGMLRCSGNMVLPGVMGVAVCVLDVIFNFLLIFPTRVLTVCSLSFTMPGAGMGVAGAALGSMSAEAVTVAVMLWYLWRRSPDLALHGRRGGFALRRDCLRRAFRIGLPMGVERFLTSGAQVMITVIVAPLGACAIAANAFAVTAESICYMPGYGISDAATTLVGQSLGAGRKTLARQMAFTCVGMGMAVMTVLGVVMYVAAPLMIGIMTPVPEIVSLGVDALRTEAWAEPMYAASIVAYGVFVGAGDTVLPAVMNLGCMWVIRISLAALLAPAYGLHGVWVAMCVELCCRGALFLWRLRSPSWLTKIDRLNR